jgi:hypothetical protein
MKCQGCGVDKDPAVLEVYPYPEEEKLCDEPIEPLLEIHCQGREFGKDPFRKVVVCHHCFSKLDVDMWISPRCWESLNPVVPFEQLELLRPATPK